MTESPKRYPAPNNLQAVVFVAGVIAVGYGAFVVLGPGSVVAALTWITAGIVLQVASGVRTTGNSERRHHLVNPLTALRDELGRLREKVRSWDQRH